MFFAYHGDLNSSKSVGTNKLIKEFAKIATSPEDIIENYPFLKKIEIVEEKEINIIDEVEDEFKKIYSVLNEKPIDVNEIIKLTNENLKEIMGKLTIMELKGYIKKVYGNRYIKYK